MKISHLITLLLLCCLENSHAQELKASSIFIPGLDSLLKAKPAMAGVTPLEGELLELFATNGCDLPQAVKVKLQKDKNTTSFIPNGLLDSLGTKDRIATFEKIDGANVRAVLHTAFYRLPNDVQKKIRVTGPDSYKNLNPMSLVDSDNFNNFIYSMDCTGYLNASLAIGAKVTIADLESKADVALKGSRSMVAVRATVASPIGVAISPDSYAFPMDRRLKIDILYTLLRTVLLEQSAAPDSTEIYAWKSVRTLWTSNEGSSSLQGRSSLSSKGGVNAGILSMNTGVSSDTSVARNISFSKFTTYIFDDSLELSAKFSKKELIDTVSSLVRNTPPSSIKRSNDTYEVEFNLPRLVCEERDWRLYSIDGTAAAGAASAFWSAAGCNFVLKPLVMGQPGGKGFQVRAPSKLNAEEFVLLVPML